jgi:hypothetical protein
MKNCLDKLEEIFLPEVEKRDENSIKGFVEKVKRLYLKRSEEEEFGQEATFKGKKPVLVYSFDCKDINNSLCLFVSANAMPYVAGVEINQQTKQLEEILDHLKGDAYFLYPNIDFSKKNYERKGLQYCIKKNKLSSISLNLDPNFRNLHEMFNSLNAEEQQILKSAPAIHVNQDCYKNNDPYNILVKINCDIKNQGDAYRFTYSLLTINMDPIPEEFYPQINGIFTVVSNKFLITYKGRVYQLGEAKHDSRS